MPGSTWRRMASGSGQSRSVGTPSSSVAIERAGAVEARAHRERKHQIAAADPTAVRLLGETARNAGAAGEAVYVSEPEQAFFRPLELACDAGEQARVCLNRQEPVHVAGGEAIAL